MNVLDKLDKELEVKKNYTLPQKRRYIYLRTCQMFSYDSRYHYCSLLGKNEGDALQKEILEKRIDLEDVTDFNIICKNYSKDVYSRALLELLNEESDICGTNHSWVEFEEDGKTIKADATLGDLTRAKLGFATSGYRPVIKDGEYGEKLKKIDQDIEYIDSDYEDALLLALSTVECDTFLIKKIVPPETKESFFNTCLMQEVEYLARNRNALLSQLPSSISDKYKLDLLDEVLITKIEKLKRALVKCQHLSTDYDTQYHINRFEDMKVLIGNFNIKLGLTESDFQQVNLFQNHNDRSWDFVTLYIYNSKSMTLYYALEKLNGYYDFHEISEEDAINYAESLKGINKEFVYHR